MAAARAADDKRASDVALLDLRGIASFTDYFVIATVSSDPQMEAVLDRIEEAIPDATLLHREGGHGNPWRLLDFGALVVHVFLRDARSFYALDRLYSEAPAVPWNVRARAAVAPKRSAVAKRRRP